MKKLKPYWFLENPLDTEHKHWILMAYLKGVRDGFGKAGYIKKIRDLYRIKKDLQSFSMNIELSQSTMTSMTDKERIIFEDLLDQKIHNDSEIKSIIDSSLYTIENFIEENKFYFHKYDDLISLESYCEKYSMWDQGFLVIRKKSENSLKIFSWFFSVIKVGDKDSVALLMTEILNPLCENTYDINRIKKFLKKKIVDDFSSEDECFILADVYDKMDWETAMDITKEKSVELIMRKFKND
jgi:hypothetical protein